MRVLTQRQVATAFGLVLRAVRTGKGISQEQIAEDADMDRTYPSLLERGRRSPNLRMLINLAHALGVEPALLVAMTVTRLGRGNDMAPDTVPITQLIENATFGASPLDAGRQAKHCDQMAREIKQWAGEAGDTGVRKQRLQLAGLFRTAARAWRRKARES
jgi:transcriptional regulator with XRE-family HTH domain